MNVFDNAAKIARELFGNTEKSEKVFGSSDKSSWMNDLKQIRKMISATINGTYKMSKRTMLMVVGGIIYVISPLDFLPEFIPFIGVLDDIAILALVYKRLKTELEKFRNSTSFQDAEVIS